MSGHIGNKHFYQIAEVEALRASGDWCNTLVCVIEQAARHQSHDPFEVYVEGKRMSLDELAEATGIPRFIGNEDPDTCGRCGARITHIATWPAVSDRLCACPRCGLIGAFTDDIEEDEEQLARTRTT